MAEIKGLQGEVNEKEINDDCNLQPSIKNPKAGSKNSMTNKSSHGEHVNKWVWLC